MIHSVFARELQESGGVSLALEDCFTSHSHLELPQLVQTTRHEDFLHVLTVLLRLRVHDARRPPQGAQSTASPWDVDDRLIGLVAVSSLGGRHDLYFGLF